MNIGDTVMAQMTVNIRNLPGYTSDIIDRLQPGDTAQLTSGPVEADGLIWWQIDGACWVAQALPDGAPLLERAQTDFDKAIAFVLGWEGGYANNPDDPGGETNWGISKRAYPGLDIKNMTRDQAIAIYQRDYWQASGANKENWPLSLIHFDSAVNCGVGQAGKWLSQSSGEAGLYLSIRLRFYTEIKGWAAFGAAWTRRVADLVAKL